MPKSNSLLQSVTQSLMWFLFFSAGLLVSCWLAWHILAQVNFAFPLGYKALDIEQHIQHFGPQNRYKQGFENTTEEEHYRLFGEIVKSIQNGGHGLAEITYSIPGKSNTPLLRNPEVVHLTDVGKLIDFFYASSWIGIFILCVCIGYFYHKQQTMPSAKSVALGVGGFVIVCVAVVLGVGPKAVFYWLHIQIFPADHEWFFYYQDSLMTTLMKAPDIFGLIAVQIAALALAFYSAILFVTQRTLSKNSPAKVPANGTKPTRKKQTPGKKKR